MAERSCSCLMEECGDVRAMPSHRKRTRWCEVCANGRDAKCCARTLVEERPAHADGAALTIPTHW
jgi:hypothetical protein